MNDPTMDRPDTRLDPQERKGRRGKRSELLTIVVDMLLISSAAWGVDFLTGQGHSVALGAMGIAIYISSQHFKLLRAEIRCLRSQLRRHADTSRRSSLPSSRPARHGEYGRAAR